MSESLSDFEEIIILTLGEAENWVDCDEFFSYSSFNRLADLGLIRICDEINYALIMPKGYKIYQELKGTQNG